MQRNRKAVLWMAVLLSAVLAGCVQSNVNRLSPDTAYITAKGGVQYDLGDIQQELMLQAANVTLDSGYDYFTITGADGGYSASNIIVPGTQTSQTTFNAYGMGNNVWGSATTNTYGYPTTVQTVEKPRGAMSIKMGRGAPPAGDPNSFDARQVKTFLESQ